MGTLHIRTWVGEEREDDCNILCGSGVQERDKDLFFGPLSETTTFIEIPSRMRWPQLLKQLGLFASTSDARRNGWDRAIEDGFSQYTIGKRHIRVTVLKISESGADSEG